MKYYAHIDTNGKILGWYNDEIHCTKTFDENNNIVLDKSKIPTPNIEVTDEVWQEALRINANCYENGKFIAKDWRTAQEIIIFEINTQIAKAKTYLASTAWYVERLNDPSSGKVIPEEVLAKRAEARKLINTLEAELCAM